MADPCAQSLADRLEKAGFEVLHVSEPRVAIGGLTDREGNPIRDEDGDVQDSDIELAIEGSITLAGNVYVQVPFVGGPSVGVPVPGPMWHIGQVHESFSALMADIKAAQQQREAWQTP